MDEKGKHLYIILVVSFSQQCWFSLFDLVVIKKQFHPFAHCIRIYYFTVSLTQNYNRNSDLYCLVWEALFRTFNLLVCASWDKVAFTGKLFQYLLFFSPAAANKAKQNHLQFIPTWLVKSKSRTSSFLFLRKKDLQGLLDVTPDSDSILSSRRNIFRILSCLLSSAALCTPKNKSLHLTRYKHMKMKRWFHTRRTLQLHFF